MTNMAWPSHQAAAAQPLSSTSRPDPTAPVQVTRREDFLLHLDSTFRLEATSDCTLVGVSALQKHLSPSGEFNSFTLLFEVPVGFVAQSKIHELFHAQMGSMNLFLSPVGHAQQHLEAVFSERV